MSSISLQSRPLDRRQGSCGGSLRLSFTVKVTNQVSNPVDTLNMGSLLDLLAERAWQDWQDWHQLQESSFAQAMASVENTQIILTPPHLPASAAPPQVLHRSLQNVPFNPKRPGVRLASQATKGTIPRAMTSGTRIHSFPAPSASILSRSSPQAPVFSATLLLNPRNWIHETSIPTELRLSIYDFLLPQWSNAQPASARTCPSY